MPVFVCDLCDEGMTFVHVEMLVRENERQT